MKNNYTFITGRKRGVATFRTLLTAVILFVSADFSNTFAQVTITVPSLTLTACPSFPTASAALGNIVITESAAGDISGSGTLILSAPAGFEFTSAGSASATGAEITGVSTALTNAAAITLTFTVGGIAELNAVTITGILVRGITAATSASAVIRNGGTSAINGDVNGAVHASLTSLDAPVLSSILSPAAICSDAVFTYSPLSPASGASFAWTRAFVTGIGNGANNGSGNPNETLTDLASSPIDVTYSYIVTANGCTNLTPFDVVVSIKPSPVLTSSLTPPAICSGTMFMYLPASASSGASFAWTRASVTGISNSLNSNSGNPNETLFDTTSSPVNVTYSYIVTANGCTNPIPFDAVVTVNPLPIMTNANTAVICNGSTLNIPLTSVASASYAWIAADNINTTGESITSQPSSALSNTITNTAASVQTVIYTVTPTSMAASCEGPPQTVTVTVVPAITMSNSAASVICSGEAVNIPLTSNTASNYTWAATDNPNTAGESVIIETTNTLNNTITNNTSSVQTVIYTAAPASVIGNCPGTPQTITVTVNPLPVMSSANTASICSGSAVNIILSSIVAATYTWAAADNINTIGESSSLQTANTLSNTITNNTASAQTLTYTVSPISITGSCAGTPQTVTVIVNTLPVSNAGSDLTICSGTAGSIGVAATAGNTYSWNPGTGLNNSEVSNPGNTTINNASTPIVTSYTVTTTITATGCQTADNAVITVNPQPVLAITSPAAVCFPNAVDITAAAVTAGSTGGGTFSYWTDAAATNTLSSPNSIAASETDYIKVTAAGGCTDIKPVTSVVNPLPVSDAGNDLSLCSGTIGSIGAAAMAGNTYSWNPGTGLSDAAVSNPVNTTVNGTSIPIVTSYTVTTTIAATGCHTSDNAVITVNPQPLSVITSPAAVCFPTAADITAASVTAGSTGGGVLTYWTDAGTVSVLSSPNALTAGGTDYIKVTAIGGCTDIKAVIVTINPQPTAAFTTQNESSSLYCDGFSIAHLTGGTGTIQVQWLDSIQTILSSIDSVGGLCTGTYTLHLSDANSCTNTYTQIINAGAIPPAPPICLVTVDSANTHNIIVWEKINLNMAAVDSFIVFREITTNVYQRIGAVMHDSLSVFDDFGANPASTGYRYKLKTKNTHAVTSLFSNYHNTIYLTNSGGNFSWTPYQIENSSTPVSAYSVYRDDNTTGNFQFIGSTTGSQFGFTDVNYASYPIASYYIEASMIGGVCQPTRSGFIASRSNIKRSGITTGAVQLNSPSVISIYPNPAGNMLNIKGIAVETTLRLFDVFGKLVIEKETENNTEINTSQLAEGVYMLLTESKTGRAFHKVVISR